MWTSFQNNIAVIYATACIIMYVSISLWYHTHHMASGNQSLSKKVIINWWPWFYLNHTSPSMQLICMCLYTIPHSVPWWVKHMTCTVCFVLNKYINVNTTSCLCAIKWVVDTLILSCICLWIILSDPRQSQGGGRWGHMSQAN